MLFACKMFMLLACLLPLLFPAMFFSPKGKFTLGLHKKRWQFLDLIHHIDRKMNQNCWEINEKWERKGFIGRFSPRIFFNVRKDFILYRMQIFFLCKLYYLWNYLWNLIYKRFLKNFDFFPWTVWWINSKNNFITFRANEV